MITHCSAPPRPLTLSRDGTVINVEQNDALIFLDLRPEM